LAGTLSIDVFMLFLIPLAPQVMAAIHVRFPTSRIIKRLHAVHNHEAREFFGQWSDLLRAAEDEYSGDIHLSTAFQETGTQNAFLAISARLKNMEEATKANREHLATITRRTEQFSPSKPSHQRTATPHSALDTFPPLFQFLPAADSALSTRFEHPMYLPLPPQYLTALCMASNAPSVPVSGGLNDHRFPQQLVNHTGLTLSPAPQ
jgi:hypothetical protein